MDSFRFVDLPWLLLLPVVGLALWLRERAPRGTAVLHSAREEIAALPRTLLLRLRAVLPWIEGVGLALLVCALARPQLGSSQAPEVLRDGVSILMLVDRSGSMEATDLDPDPGDRVRLTRLDLVKKVLVDFVDTEGELPGRPDDAVGLVSFCGYVQSHCPPTLDHGLVTELMKGLRVPDGRRGNDPVLATAMGDGLVTAVSRLEDVPAESKVIILLSDGVNNAGEASPSSAAQLARDAGVRVHAIGFGRAGSRGGYDPRALREIAETTGGLSFNARDVAELAQVYRRIDEMERREIATRRRTRWADRFWWPLVAGLVLLGLHRGLVWTRFRSLP